MQVSADSPISDDESIVRAVREHLKNSTIVLGEHGPDYQSTRAALARYNANPIFVELANLIFWQLYVETRTEREPTGAMHTKSVPDVDNVRPPAGAEREAVATTDRESESKRRVDLLGQSASLCVLATLNLSTATVDELGQLNHAIAVFLRGQAQRTGERNTPPT